MTSDAYPTAQPAEPSLQTLFQVQERVLAMDRETQLPDVLREIAEGAKDVLDGHLCLVQPYDAERDEFLLDLFTAAGPAEAHTFTWLPPRPQGSARTTLKRGLLIVEDYERDLPRYPFLAGSTGSLKDFADVKALIGVRLETAGEAVGVLFVDYLQPREFSPTDIQTLQLFAGQAAVAIKNARLLESLNQASQQLDRRVKELSALQQMTKVVFETLNLDEVLTVFLQQITEALGFEYAVVSLVDAGRQRIESKHMIEGEQLDAWPDYLPMSNYSLSDKDIIADVVRTGKTEIIGDWDERFNRAIWERYGHERLLRIFMPIKGRGEQVIGVVEAGFDKSHKVAITAEEVAALESYVRQVSSGIQNATLYHGTERLRQEEEDEHTKVLGLVREINQWVLEENGDLEKLAALTIRRLLELFPFEAGWLLLAEGLNLRVIAADPANQDDVGRLLSQHGSISGYVAAQRKPVHINNLALEPEEVQLRYKKPLAKSNDMTSILAVPLLVEDRCIGVLNLESSGPNAFGEHHLLLMQMFAQHLVVAIKSVRALQDEQLFGKIAHEVSGSQDVEQTARYLLEEALKRIGSGPGAEEMGQLMFLRSDDTLVVEHATGGVGLGRELKVDDCASGLVMLAPEDPYRRQLTEEGSILIYNESIIIPDVSKLARYKAPLTTKSSPGATAQPGPNEETRMRSELIVPLIAEKEPIGVLNLESSQAAYFTEEHALFIERIAGFVATVIQNTRAAQAKLDAEELALPAQKIHDLSGSVSAIVVFLGDIKEPILRAIADDDLTVFELLVKEVGKLDAKMQALRAPNDESITVTRLADSIDEALQKLKLPGSIRLVRDEEAELELPPVRANSRLSEVFFNVMNNAVRLMPNGGFLSIEAELDSSGRWVDVVICDAGPGIERERWDTIFSGDSDRKGGVHGFGLRSSRLMLNKYGGKILVRSSTIGEGSCFKIRLQVAQ